MLKSHLPSIHPQFIPPKYFSSLNRLKVRSLSFLLCSLFSTALTATIAPFVVAQPTLESSLSTPITFIPPIPPGAGRDGEDTQQVDLGSRSPGDEGYLTALVPAEGIALTTATHPSFWVYVPGMMDDIESMEFLLRRRQTGQVESFTVEQPFLDSQPALPGVVELTLPAHADPLEIGEIYDWSLIVNYHIPPQGHGIGLAYEHFVVASIQRQDPSPDLEVALNQATSVREQAAAYAQHGIWHEALTLVGKRYHADPEDASFAADWTSVLTAVDLESHPQFPFAIPFDSTLLSEKAIAQCCSLNNPDSIAQEL